MTGNFIRYIDSLTRNLDISAARKDAESGDEGVYQATMNNKTIKEDASAIGSVYSLIYADKLDEILRGKGVI
jgi:hypothetical protein